MKYAQLVMGLLIGTALGGVFVATQGAGGGNMNEEQIRKIVLNVIDEEPQAIMESLQKFQMAERDRSTAEANKKLEDPATQEALFKDEALPYLGNKNGSKVLAEFYDYDCPVCKTQFQMFQELLKNDPEIKIVLHEFPIFGPVSEENSHLSLAVNALYPEKFAEFHTKMMEGKGHEKTADRTYKIIKDLGMDVEKVKERALSDEIGTQLQASRDLGGKLNIRGTPALILPNEVIPHAADAGTIEQKLSATE